MTPKPESLLASGNDDGQDVWDEDGMLVADDGPADCPGGGIDDLCSWPDIESCGLCTLGMNPDLL